MDFGPNFSVFVAKGDPLSYSETMRSHDAIFWKETVDDEIQFMMSINI